MKLTKLQRLAESAGTDKAKNRDKVTRIFEPFEDMLEKAIDAVKKIQTSLESDVLSDMYKQEKFPATESSAAKKAAAAALKALRELDQEVLDLYQGLGSHFDEDLDESIKEDGDVYVFTTGSEEGSPRRTSGDAEKICKKMLAVFKSDLKDMDATPEEMAKFKKMSEITDPVKLFKALIKSELCWDGYDIELTKNGKTVTKPNVTRF